MSEMKRKVTEDDLARAIGNRAIKHLREMYPQVYAASYPSCRLSLRNHIRNDVTALIKAMIAHDIGKIAHELWDLDIPEEVEVFALENLSG